VKSIAEVGPGDFWGSEIPEMLMNSETGETAKTNLNWQPWQVYVMAGICLLVGLTVGYLVRGSAPAVSSATAVQKTPVSSTSQRMPSLEDMRRMADQQAAPLLGRLKTDPNNADLLNQIGSIYRVTHQFDTAASYYQKSLEANPKNVGARTDLASCLFYQGDVNGAIAQLEKSLTYDPKHAGTLLNLGIVRWKGKNDAAGAIKSWNKLLQYHPDYENKPMVERLIGEAKGQSAKLLQNQ
jgi:cytochrome c-type biogenesis protein CcmH/NrfG